MIGLAIVAAFVATSTPVTAGKISRETCRVVKILKNGREVTMTTNSERDTSTRDSSGNGRSSAASISSSSRSSSSSVSVSSSTGSKGTARAISSHTDEHGRKVTTTRDESGCKTVIDERDT